MSLNISALRSALWDLMREHNLSELKVEASMSWEESYDPETGEESGCWVIDELTGTAEGQWEDTQSL